MNNRSGSYGGYQQPYQGSTNPTIKNPSSPFEKGQEFSDRDRLNDILATEKYLTDGFNVFVREASHQDLFQDVLYILNETHHACRNVFNLMFEKGWYSLHPEQPSQIAKEHRKFAGYENQFPTQSQTQSHYGGGSSYFRDY